VTRGRVGTQRRSLSPAGGACAHTSHGEDDDDDYYYDDDDDGEDDQRGGWRRAGSERVSGIPSHFALAQKGVKIKNKIKKKTSD